MCKGLELESFKVPSEILEESLPGLPCGVLSGPTYASEVAAGQPTAVVLALPKTLEARRRYLEAFSNTSLRCYLSEDVRGTELGGTLKNVYAIGSGMCDGLQLGDNAKAAYLTRSLNEMLALGTALGGKAETFYGLSGFGDLIATCSGEWSRNRTFGEQVGRGQHAESIINNQKTVVEGYRATDCLHRYCKQGEVDAPILEMIYSVLYEDLKPKDAIYALMTRDLRAE
jgi:glycerol-3-phosphate dehydrogenase (NAD(P)+)